MKEVTIIPIISKQKETKVEFTHFLTSDGWKKSINEPSDYVEVVYLGRHTNFGDMFVAYSRMDDPDFLIYKGNLNDGVY
jgi:hypothetical protein